MKKLALFGLIMTMLTALSGCAPLKQTAIPVAIDVVIDEAETLNGTDSLVAPSIDDKKEDSEDKPKDEVVVKNLPAVFDNKVQFSSQAPLGSWDMPYQETCEEASLITVARFFAYQNLDTNIMNSELFGVIEWEKKTWNLYTDTNVEEVASMARKYFGLQAEVVTDVSVDRIKQELVSGKLVVAPFAGRMLGNQFFSGKGPIYHMLVIRGYDRSNFITNDVGTRHGEAYKYPYDRLIKAMHDLPNNVDGTVFRPYDDQSRTDEEKEAFMATGRKAMIVLSE
jgi:hypothetical protein